MNVGVMKNYKLRDLCASHTPGWSWNYSALFICLSSRLFFLKKKTPNTDAKSTVT